MKNHLTDKYDLMAETVKRLRAVLFDEDCKDRSAVSEACAILAEHELISDQIEARYAP